MNKYIVLEHIKFEDWKLASQLLHSKQFLFSFDLKSGYHHIDIHPDFQSFLGFSWQVGGVTKFYYFTVLPFGLASAGHIFTKVVRCLVKHWRALSIPIIVYLDDGLGISESFEEASANALRVRADLIRSGFVINSKKSNWSPVTSLTWLGVDIDSDLGLFAYLRERLSQFALCFFLYCLLGELRLAL